jgi:hypothetical protein
MDQFLGGGGFSHGSRIIVEGDGQTNVPTHLRKEGSFTMTLGGYSTPEILRQLDIHIAKHNFDGVKTYIINKYLINNNTFSVTDEVIDEYSKIEDIQEFKTKVVKLINLVNFSKKNPIVIPSGKLVDYHTIKAIYDEEVSN